jgi:hypothetical protein
MLPHLQTYCLSHSLRSEIHISNALSEGCQPWPLNVAFRQFKIEFCMHLAIDSTTYWRSVHKAFRQRSKSYSNMRNDAFSHRRSSDQQEQY